MEIFHQETKNLLMFVTSIKKKEREDWFKPVLDGLSNMDCSGKPLVICSNYMDACRDIQRVDTEEALRGLRNGIFISDKIFKQGAEHFDQCYQQQFKKELKRSSVIEEQQIKDLEAESKKKEDRKSLIERVNKIYSFK